MKQSRSSQQCGKFPSVLICCLFPYSGILNLLIFFCRISLSWVMKMHLWGHQLSKTAQHIRWHSSWKVLQRKHSDIASSNIRDSGEENQHYHCQQKIQKMMWCNNKCIWHIIHENQGIPSKNNLGNLLNMSKMRHSSHYTKCKPYECIRKNINFGVFL